MTITGKLTANRNLFRKTYAYGLNRRPAIHEFYDSVTALSKSLNFQQIIRDRSFFIIAKSTQPSSSVSSSIVQFLEEDWHTTGSVDHIAVTFPFTFNETPFLAFRLYPEWVLSSGSNVAYWVTDLSTTGFTASFSAPYEGRLTYRAVYTDGGYPVYVERATGSFAWIAAAQTSSLQSTVTMSFASLPGTPEEVFSNPVGSGSDSSLNIAQSYADVGTDFTTINFSAPYVGLIDIVAMSTVPTGSPQPVDPP